EAPPSTKTAAAGTSPRASRRAAGGRAGNDPASGRRSAGADAPGGPPEAAGQVATGGAGRGRRRDPAARGERAGAPTAPSETPVDDALPELPERLRDGRPSPEAADRATVRRPKIGDTRPAPPVPPSPPAPDAGADAASPPAAGEAAPAVGRRRRRRGGRGRSGAGRAVGAVLDLDEPVDLDDETLERRRGRERKGRPVGRYLMCVHSTPHATQIAVLEGRSLTEHYVARPADDTTQIHGNIYLGRVQNVLPGMEAAFVDIGTPKNAVLYRGDVQYDPEDVEEKNGARIEHMLRAGQTVLCQVTKNPIGTKGARLTQEVSLAGRFVVLLPGSTTYGISKRLPDEERRRLRRILDEVRPQAHGLIVRTAAEGATAEELRRDVERLRRQWDQIEELSRRKSAPALLYREPPLAVRVIREEFNRDYRGVIIDDPDLHREVHDYVASLIPELADRIELYDDPTLPLFERHHVHEQLHKALDRKVWLPSGGSLIIERTEALTVIDVNTGKNVGSSSLEETVYRNNLEAAEEIAHQLRLRDIGGIIVIDFIDMEVRKNREAVLRTFKEALARDKTRTQVFDISELGLVEMTRKRVSEGLVESFSMTCPTCAGRGIVLDDSLL
ncbi:MAG TPA: Rne/Rng family ribonuclease, partial [Acidimicrobiales bacterium]|nr:Rne/Rng family ribonuclease [Acidimicrobiales bacterium]